MGNRAVPLMELSIVEVPACRIEPAGVFRRLRESPGKIAVPILSVSLSFHFLAARPDSLGFAAV